MLITDDNGTDQQGAGTSLSSPLWLGMWTRIQAAAAKKGLGFANRSLYIPRCTNALKAARDRMIRKDSDSMPIQELILKYGLSERQLWRILKASAV